MRVIVQEWKKLFQPLPVVLCLLVFALCALGIPGTYLQTKTLLNTREYPDRFTCYDDCSVGILFSDFLLETYGKVITEDDIADLAQRRAKLLDQVDAAASKDAVLLRREVYFDKEKASFFSNAEPGTEFEFTASEEDQIYEWSCVNGQMRLEGTDYPIGFLTRMENVISEVTENGEYPVLPTDALTMLRGNIDILLGFVAAAWVLVLPYGVAETKSNTQVLSFTTKQGRTSYFKKVAAAWIPCALLIGVGTLIAAVLFLSMGAERYYDAQIGVAIRNLYLDAPGDLRLIDCYVLLLGMTSILGLFSSLAIIHISLMFRYAVSALACSIPVAAAFVGWYLIFIRFALDYGDSQITLRNGVLSMLVISLTVCVFSVIVLMRKYKTNYL